ncbi:MAG: MATE family efflux transporter [Firmicutes bacterium]|nr:MATE family efflux transporter [Bacillota bacterium]
MSPSLFKDFVKYVSQNILGMIGLSFYILVDTFFIANGIGPDGLAALNLAIPIFSFITGSGLMLGIGGAIYYSIHKSKGPEIGDQAFTNAVQFGAVLGILFFIIGVFFAENLSLLLGADSFTFAMTITYLRTILCFAPLFIFNNILIAFVRNDKNPRLAMVGMLAGSIFNIIFDYIFIFIFDLGMFGAAFATGLAPLISMLVLSPFFLKKQNQFHLVKTKSDFTLWYKIGTLGFPSLITELASGVVLIIFNLILLNLGGNIAVAAYGVIANLSLVVVAFFTGVGQGIQPLISYHFGRGKTEAIKQILRYGIILTVVLAIGQYLVMAIFSTEIASLFNKHNDDILNAVATRGMKIYFVGFFFAGLNVLLSAYYSAKGQARTAFLISILRGFILVIPLAFLLSSLIGVDGVWLTFPLTEAVVLGYCLFQRGMSRGRQNLTHYIKFQED